MQSDRNIWIEWLRGLASLWVVFFHLNEVLPDQANWYRIFAGLGWLGVPIFFVISGYCIYLAAERSSSSGTFLWRRLWRIWPPYVASVALVLAVIIYRKLLTGYNDVTPLPNGAVEWINTFFLLIQPATETKAINWVYWSLTIEAAFYLVVAIALVKKRFLDAILLGVTLLALLPAANFPPGFFWLPSWPFFALGIGTYKIGSADRASGSVFAALGVVGMMLHQPLSAQIAGFVAAATIIGSDYFRPRLSERGPLARLGEVSYSLYLIHIPVGIFLLQFLRTIFGSETVWRNIATDLIMAATTVVAAVAFHVVIERPSMRLGRWQPWRRSDPLVSPA